MADGMSGFMGRGFGGGLAGGMGRYGNYGRRQRIVGRNYDCM